MYINKQKTKMTNMLRQQNILIKNKHKIMEKILTKDVQK